MFVRVKYFANFRKHIHILRTWRSATKSWDRSD